MAMTLRVAHLYPKMMNIYGDRGNILCLVRRCQRRGIEVDVVDLGLGEPLISSRHDLFFMGGAQDQEQLQVAEDLVQTKGQALRQEVEGGCVLLAVCGAYQLMGRYYRPAGGGELPGVGLFDAWTEYPGTTSRRLIGNVVAEWQDSTLVGFENHGGRTYLGERVKPLARVLTGHGNNGADKWEGAVYRGAFGTYLHGSILPKNPRFADHLIAMALQRRYGDVELEPLDDIVEHRAHKAALRKGARRGFLRRGNR